MITIIAAIARNGAIGIAGAIPWHAPEDLAHFRGVTLGHAVVMGRKTWESLPAKARPLPVRLNFVCSRRPNPSIIDAGADGVVLDVAGFLRDCVESGIDAAIIGGAQVYREAMPLADRLLITEVDIDVPDADTWFPNHARIGDMLVFGDYVDGNSPVFSLVSSRPGTDPRLTFCEWRRCS